MFLSFPGRPACHPLLSPIGLPLCDLLLRSTATYLHRLQVSVGRPNPPLSMRHAALPHPLLSFSRLRFKAIGVLFRPPFLCASSSPFSSASKASPLSTSINWPPPGTSDHFPSTKSVKSPPPPVFLVRADTVRVSSLLLYSIQLSPSSSCLPFCRRDVGCCWSL
jgi:hypothetical protein